MASANVLRRRNEADVAGMLERGEAAGGAQEGLHQLSKSSQIPVVWTRFATHEF